MTDHCERCGTELPPAKTKRKKFCKACAWQVKLAGQRARYAEKGRKRQHFNRGEGVKCIRENSVYMPGHYYNEGYVRADIRAGLVPKEAFQW